MADPRVCAVGEIGLDYHYDLSPRDVQRRVFSQQIDLACEAGLPVVLHVRDAHEEALGILVDRGFPEAGVLLHCCSLDEGQIAPWVEAGCRIGYGGALTFKNAEDARIAAARVPIDLLLTETDAPYMTPEPMRGVMCTPSHTVFTADLLAQLRCGEDEDGRQSVLDALYANALSLLDREPSSWQVERFGEQAPSGERSPAERTADVRDIAR